MSSITYRALDHRELEFRILRLCATTDPQHNLMPECHIIHSSLKEKPQYTALSYCWGNPEQNRVIIVNGVGVRVSKNLYEALIAMRPSQGATLIWIDFLCINQRDDSEKSSQVKLMGTIYSQASHVFIWLGPNDNESVSTIAYLDTLGKQAELCGFVTNPYIANTTWRGLALGGGILHCVLHPAARDPHRQLNVFNRLVNLYHWISQGQSMNRPLPVQGTIALFKRAWFGRIWVLQEIALAKRAEFVCGSSRISRNRLCAAVNAYQAFQQAVGAEIKDRGPHSISVYHLDIFLNFQYRPSVMLNAHRLYQNRLFPLVALLRLTCIGSINLSRHGPHHLESTDPRDKIFALLGLASDQGELSAKGLWPDYTKSNKDVYILAASIMLQQGYTSILSHVQYPKSISELPSWVPDWSTSMTEPLQIPENDHVTMEPHFSASGALKSTTYRLEDQPRKLFWQSGIIFDRIHRIGSFPHRRSTFEVPLEKTYSWAEEWLFEILRLTYSVRRPYATFAERLQAVVRVAVGGAAYTDNTDVLYRVGNSRFLEGAFLLHMGRERIKNQIFGRECQDFLDAFVPEHGQKFSAMNLMSLHLIQEINGRSLRRVPFVTEEGYLGLSSDQIRVADQTVIMTGAEVPFILRERRSGSPQLISEAYIEGVMDGELAVESNFVPLSME